MPHSDGTGTPPHEPTFNVRLSDACVRSIVAAFFAECNDVSIDQLTRGKSYNNRIYFVDVWDGKATRELVLKAIGRFWGADKVENEVSCLLLLKRYCPNVPVPRVRGWSPDGLAYCQLDDDLQNGEWKASKWLKPTSSGGGIKETDTNHGWILMERQPGRVLDPKEDLAGDRGRSIAEQLAGFVHDWRTRLPLRREFGNLWLNFETVGQGAVLNEARIAGNILWGHNRTALQKTKLDYYAGCIENKLIDLKQNANCQSTQTSGIIALVEDFVRRDFLGLDMFSADVDQSPRFTHNDFAPRNILVQEDGGMLKVTGILDFEFAGYFPAEDEFTNLVNGDDWPDTFGSLFLSALGRLGDEVAPVSGLVDCKTLPPRQWQEAYLVSNLIEDIAPWFAAVGGVQGDKLEEKLLQAADRVRDGITKLRQLLGQEPAQEMNGSI